MKDRAGASVDTGAIVVGPPGVGVVVPVPGGIIVLTFTTMVPIGGMAAVAVVVLAVSAVGVVPVGGVVTHGALRPTKGGGPNEGK